MSIHDGHRARLRQQLKKSGIESFSDIQALELLLCYAIPRQDTNVIAHRLLERFRSIDCVFEASVEALCEVQGVGQSAAELICLVPELERRHLIGRSAAVRILDTTEKCANYLLPFFHGEQEEIVYLLCLDAKCKILDCTLVHRGSVNSANVSIRSIVKTALLSNASSVVLAHNHPSGIALPSEEDRQTTLALDAALDAVDIVLADHIIVAEQDYVSLRDDGILR